MNAFQEAINKSGVGPNNTGSKGVTFVLLSAPAEIEELDPGVNARRTVLERFAPWKESGGYLELARVLGDPSV